jgi:dihydrofolate synthase/folylpolyglutamate synthase
MEVLRQAAAQAGAPFEIAPASWNGPLALAGAHQRGNAGLAAAGLRALRRAGVTVGEAEIARGLATTRWPGRLELLDGLLLDGAHNPDGARALAVALSDLHPGRPVELVFGALGDKDHRAMLAALAGAVRRLHLVEPRTPRARAVGDLLSAAGALGMAAVTYGRLGEALAGARAAAGDGTPVVVAGSLYLVGEARALVRTR